jgi:P4 family phage/plasmid primase-like protien
MLERPRPAEETKPKTIETFDVTTFETSIPEELKKLNRWVLRRGKIPHPRKGWDDPKNQFSFDEVLDAYSTASNKEDLGIGFVVLPDDEITFIDFDGCLPEHEKEAQKAIMEFASWTEISRSETGIHILGQGKTSEKSKIETELPFQVEIYGGGEARHIAMTGNVYQGYEHFNHIEKQTKSFIQKHATKKTSKSTDTLMVLEGGRNTTLYNALCTFYMRKTRTKEGFTTELKNQGLSYALRFVKEKMPSPLEATEIQKINDNAFNYCEKGFDSNKKPQINSLTGMDIHECMTEVFLVDEIVFPQLVDHVRWLEDTKQWAVFDHRKQWVIDVSSKVKHMIKMVLKDKILERLRNDYPQVFEPQTGDEKALRFKSTVERWGYGYQQNKNIAQVVSLFQCDQRISARYSEFDTRGVGNYFPVENGAIDLKTGLLIDYTPEMKITRRAGVFGQYDGIRYDPQATCPKWGKFIKQITCEDESLAKFLQRLFGYLMSAGNPERKIFTFYGEGRNGKTTLIKVITKIMGEVTTGGFSRKIPITALLKKQFDSNGEELVLAMKARFAYSSESDDGKTYNQALLKDISGGGTIAARQHYVGTLNGEPDFTLVIDTNFPIAFSATDQAMVDRVVQVPFDWRVPDGQQNLNLEAELLEEREGILAWMVRGALQYVEHGLGACDAVERATTAYVRENNSVALFAESYLRRLPQGSMRDVQVGDVHKKYTDFCNKPESGSPIQALSMKTFNKEMEKIGYTKSEPRRGRSFWIDIEIINQNEDSESLTQEDVDGGVPF